MKVNDFLKKQRIKKIYSYHEEKQDKRTTAFGWVPSKSLDLNNPVIISVASRGQKVMQTDKDWSEREGNSAASIADYEKYFRALTGESSIDFIEKWEHKVDELEGVRKRISKSYREEEGAFLLSLAKLLSNGKKFTKFGRIYKIIDPNT